MRILIVEDDKDLNRQLADAFEEAGYVVDKAHDGEEGHFLGDTEPYDAIVLDIGLPEMDGISVLENWRREAATRRSSSLLLVIAGTTRYPASMPVLTITSPNPFTSRKFWRGCAHLSAARRDMLHP